MPLARFVPVRDDYDAAAAKVLRVLGTPVTCTAWVRRGYEAKTTQAFNVFLAFDNEYKRRGVSSHELWKAVQNGINAIAVFDPTASSIGPTLTEVLRAVAHDLEKNLAFFVLVLVSRFDNPRLRSSAGRDGFVVLTTAVAWTTQYVRRGGILSGGMTGRRYSGAMRYTAVSGQEAVATLADATPIVVAPAANGAGVPLLEAPCRFDTHR